MKSWILSVLNMCIQHWWTFHSDHRTSEWLERSDTAPGDVWQEACAGHPLTGAEKDWEWTGSETATEGTASKKRLWRQSRHNSEGIHSQDKQLWCVNFICAVA